MRPNLAPPRLPTRTQPSHHNPPRVSGYTPSARTLTARSLLPRPRALETRKCVHRSQHPYQYHQEQQQQYHHQYQQQQHQYRQHRYHYSCNLSYNYDYEEDEEYDDRFQRYSRLPHLRSAPGTLMFVNLLVKRFLCFLTCSPCGLRGAA